MDRGQMAKFDYKGYADSIKFIAKPIVMDFTSLRDYLSDTENIGISDQQKIDLLKIINSKATFEDKFLQIQQHPSFEVLRRNVFKERVLLDL